VAKFRIPTKAIITDAGFASRYLPITKTIPKGMLPIGNKPIMQLVVEECAEAGIKEIIIVATHEGAPIYKDYFTSSVPHIREQLASQGKDDRYAAVLEVLDLPKIAVIEQDKSLPYGTASPILSARNYIADDEAFVSMQADDIIFGQGDAKTLIDFYRDHRDAKAVIAAQPMEKSVWNRYGMIALKDEKKMTLSHIVEKPAKPEDSPSDLTSYGRYLLTPEIFEYFDTVGLDNELWQVDGITKMAQVGDVYVVPTKGKWMTTGDPKNYFKAYLQYVKDNESYDEDIHELFCKS
jgi:UTP--glucose-1-phosphate uridylyltransferase